MRYITSLFNTLLILFFAAAVIVASRITHQMELHYLLGTIPSLFAWWFLLKGGNQIIRVIGIFTNALLAIGGAIGFLAILMATMNFHDLAVSITFSLLLAVTGVTNFYFLLKAPNGPSKANA